MIKQYDKRKRVIRINQQGIPKDKRMTPIQPNDEILYINSQI